MEFPPGMDIREIPSSPIPEGQTLTFDHVGNYVSGIQGSVASDDYICELACGDGEEPSTSSTTTTTTTSTTTTEVEETTTTEEATTTTEAGPCGPGWDQVPGDEETCVRFGTTA